MLMRSGCRWHINTPPDAVYNTQALWDCLLPWHHRYPVAHAGVHKEIEKFGQEGVAMCHPVESLERGAMVSYRIFYHGEPSPVRLEDLELPGAYAVACQDAEALVPIKGAVPLMDVQEYLVEDLLPHFCKILEQLGFEGGSPRPPDCPGPM